MSLYGLAVAHGLFDVVHEDTAALQAEFAGDELAVAIHKERGWQHADAAVAVGNGILADQDGVVDVHFLRELRYFFGAGVVHGHADDLKSLRAILFLHLYKPRHFDLAGTAIRCPGIEQNRFATKIGELEILTIER